MNERIRMNQSLNRSIKWFSQRHLVCPYIINLMIDWKCILLQRLWSAAQSMTILFVIFKLNKTSKLPDIQVLVDIRQEHRKEDNSLLLLQVLTTVCTDLFRTEKRLFTQYLVKQDFSNITTATQLTMPFLLNLSHQRPVCDQLRQVVT